MARHVSNMLSRRRGGVPNTRPGRTAVRRNSYCRPSDLRPMKDVLTSRALPNHTDFRYQFTYNIKSDMSQIRIMLEG